MKYKKRLKLMAPFLAIYGATWIWSLFRADVILNNLSTSSPWDVQLAVVGNVLSLFIIFMLQCTGYGGDQ